MSGILADTNLLLYCYDRRAPAKQEMAINVVGELARSGAGRLSVQCLAEFVKVAIRARKPILTAEEAAASVANYARKWKILDITAEVVERAARAVRAHRLNYWDAQIWATARINEVETIFSEDFSSGTSLDGVRFVNPFAAGFELARWV